MKKKTTRLILTRAEFHTIIAALRYYQQQGLGDPANRPMAIHLLAINAWDEDDEGEVTSLDSAGIDELVQRLNTI